MGNEIDYWEMLMYDIFQCHVTETTIEGYIEWLKSLTPEKLEEYKQQSNLEYRPENLNFKEKRSHV